MKSDQIGELLGIELGQFINFSVFIRGFSPKIFRFRLPLVTKLGLLRLMMSGLSELSSVTDDFATRFATRCILVWEFLGVCFRSLSFSKFNLLTELSQVLGEQFLMNSDHLGELLGL